MKFPQRHPNHSLEEKSITFFRSCIPDNWNINSIDRDYGQDLNLEIAEDGVYKGLELIIQLKASNQSRILSNSECQTFRVSTYNYLRNNLRVAMIVKYIETENDAYWILLKDVEDPAQENESFTIHIPRENKLTEINWQSIVDYVREVTDTKLAAMRVRNKR